MAIKLLPGSVTLVGGGPGDPGLITVDGLSAIKQADVIIYDHLAPLECLSEAHDNAKVISVGKVPGGEFTPQEKINELLITNAKAKLKVVRLKGGDSFVFGRGGEEWQACTKADIPVRVIPGVTSCVAAPELAGIPVTHRSLIQGFTVVSGHVPPQDPRSKVDWASLAHSGTTLVILMGIHHLNSIIECLLDNGMASETPSAVIAAAGRTDMRVIRGKLSDIASQSKEAKISPPAVTVIGNVVELDLINSSTEINPVD